MVLNRRWWVCALSRRVVNVRLVQSWRELCRFYKSWCCYGGWHDGCSRSKPLHCVLLLLCKPVLWLPFLFVSCTLCCSTVLLNKILQTSIPCSNPGFAIWTKYASIFIDCWYLLWFSTLDSYVTKQSFTSSVISHLWCALLSTQSGRAFQKGASGGELLSKFVIQISCDHPKKKILSAFSRELTNQSSVRDSRAGPPLIVGNKGFKAANMKIASTRTFSFNAQFPL